ncbi:MAG: hypothetical protein ACK5AV_01020 [Alphaproteobacteria bacterium]|jgi:hypothetical protein|nr:hypothetical protein [Candidatus Jidaibacter sp.]
MLYGIDPVKFAIIADVNIEDKKALDYALEHDVKIDGMSPIALCILREIHDYIPDQKPDDLLAEVERCTLDGSEIYGMDPIRFAIIAGVKINNKPAITYAIDEGKNINFLDPIQYAALHDINIQGQNPVLWAIDNVRQIGGADPIKSAIQNRQIVNGKDVIEWAILEGKLIEAEDPLVYAYTNSIEINNIHPLEWAALRNRKIYGAEPVQIALNNHFKISGEHPVKWAITHNARIDGMDPILGAFKLDMRIESQDVIQWAWQNDDRDIIIKRAWIYAYENNVDIEGMNPSVWLFKNHKIVMEHKNTYNKIVGYAILKGKLFSKELLDSLSREQKVELLSNMLEMFMHLDKINDKNMIDLMRHEYNVVVKDLNIDQSIITLQSSRFDKASTCSIARKIDNLMEGIYRNTSHITSSSLLLKCDFDMAVKVVDVGRELNITKENGKNYIAECFDAICEALKKVWLGKAKVITMDNVDNFLKAVSSRDHKAALDVKSSALESFAERASVKRDDK